MLNIRKSIMRPAAVMLSAVMLVGSSFVSGNNIDSATETEGTTYIKHYYNSNKPDEEYTLEPIEYSTSFAMPRWIGDDDHRPNANPVPSGIVKLGNSGTAFIVGEHEIMTAAHCVYNASEHDFHDNNHISLMISENQPFSNGIALTEIACHIPKQYKSEIDNNNKFSRSTYPYDYAIITVKEDLSDYGIFNLGMTTQNVVDHTPIHTYGYSFASAKPFLKVSDGIISEANDQGYLISEDCYITDGTSGGPLVTKCKINGTEYWEAIGIVSAKDFYPTFDPSFIQHYIAVYNRVDNETLQFLNRNDYLYEEEFIWQE